MARRRRRRDAASRPSGDALVTDRHIRILRVVARHRQRQLDDHDAADAVPNAGSTARLHDLEWTAARTRARVAAAEARRRQPAPSPAGS
jgi:hypothetical protein